MSVRSKTQIYASTGQAIYFGPSLGHSSPDDSIIIINPKTRDSNDDYVFWSGVNDASRIIMNAGGRLSLLGTVPLQIPTRSEPPASPSTNDIYLDDGTNTVSTKIGLRRYTGSTWQDISEVPGGATAYPTSLFTSGEDRTVEVESNARVVFDLNSTGTSAITAATESGSGIFIDTTNATSDGYVIFVGPTGGSPVLSLTEGGDLSIGGLLTLDPLGNYSSTTGIALGPDGLLIQNVLTDIYWTTQFENYDCLFSFTDVTATEEEKSAIICTPSWDTSSLPMLGMLMYTKETENRLCLGGGSWIPSATNVYIYTGTLGAIPGSVRASWDSTGLFTNTGKATFTGVPSAATLAGASVSINPASATAGYLGLAIGTNDVLKASITAAEGKAYFGGDVGIGINRSTAPAKFEVLSSTEQLRLSRSSDIYIPFTVNEVGQLTIGETGTINRHNQIVMQSRLLASTTNTQLTLSPDIRPATTQDNMYGLKIIPTVSNYAAGAESTNYYGIYVLNPTGTGTITNNYGAYFEGKVGVANTNPTYTLDVTGDFRATSNAVIGGTLTVTGGITGGMVRTIAAKTSDYTILTTDYTILLDGTSNTVTATLPASPVEGQMYNIKCIDSTYTVTVARNGNNIDGDAADFTLIEDEVITVQADSNGDWWII